MWCRLGWGLLGSVLHVAAQAAFELPDHLTGTWGTGASLYDGTGPQGDLYLMADGQGVMAGSGPAPVRVDGKDDGKLAVRAVIGFAVRSTWQDDVLTIKPYTDDPVQAAKLERVQAHFTCTYDPAVPSLACTTYPTHELFVFKRRSADVPAEIVRMLGAPR
ncbi:hypothetical protein [Pseudoduganella ginsengisoli]|uniref:Uncharacterized protein n=1 Tax=Pseudoduganella ginsengisoli TaxID=1462440 RepID=A0A6L6PWH8_9BURK|nr:hypothetical protein [Pseudoduganella ginsengisoli]MTW01514.1 hypothetical protein [Pseudoduganella ginsengisoli]